MKPHASPRGREGRRLRRAFTLVEILIVVIILGILAAIITPHFLGAVDEARIGATSHELAKLRRAIEVYQIQNHNALPDVTEGEGTWGALTSGNEYLKSAPLNPYVGGANAKVIVFGSGPDSAYQNDHAWIYDSATGRVWAGSFDSDDLPIDP